MATVLERSKVSAPADAVSVLSLPLLFFNMLCYDQSPTQSIYFFQSICSKPQFLHHVLPALKHSLSLTLAHFLPLAGNIVHPRSSTAMPTVQFHPGQDYVPFTVCESNSDNFCHLTGNHPRDSSDFYEFVPQLPAATHLPDAVTVPVLALMVTLFPGSGISVGIASCHVFVDGSTMDAFIRAWALINRTTVGTVDQAKSLLQENKLFPNYETTAFVDINGLNSTYWRLIVARPHSLPILPSKSMAGKNLVRSTVVLKKEEIQKLRGFVLQKLTSDDVSTFSVVCGLVWSCFAMSAAACGDNVPDDEPDYFSYRVDCRERKDMDPLFCRNYLGCCIANFTIWLKHGELKGDEGFVRAAAFISEEIQETVYNNEKGILLEAEAWLPKLWNDAGKRLFWVDGSPKFDIYGVDFGWGRPNKFETLSTDCLRSISLCKSRWVEGGLEIGLSKPKGEMDAFITVFQKSVSDLCLSKL